MSDRPCPICGEIATALNAADYDCLSFDCKGCGRFDVTGTALVQLKTRTQVSRQDALEKAKRWNMEEIPEIPSQCL